MTVSRSGSAVGTSSSRMTSSYTDLAQAVRESGLLERRQGYYWTSIALTIAAFLATATVVVLLGNSWWQLLLAAVLGLIITQFGFLGHDAAHRQIFTSAAWNDWTARILSGAFAGLSYGWWKGKHNRHHAAPNQQGRDPDIASSVLTFTGDLAAARSGGARGWFLRRQGWLFFPLLTFEGLNLHVAGLRMLTGRGPVRHRAVELILADGDLAAEVDRLMALGATRLDGTGDAVELADPDSNEFSLTHG